MEISLLFGVLFLFTGSLESCMEAEPVQIMSRECSSKLRQPHICFLSCHVTSFNQCDHWDTRKVYPMAFYLKRNSASRWVGHVVCGD